MIYKRYISDGSGIILRIKNNGLVGNYFTQASHYDYGSGRMSPNYRNDAAIAVSWYALTGAINRGAVDLNFTRTDGSSFRITNIDVQDDRLTKVDYKYGNANADHDTAWTLLPSIDY